MTINYRDHLTLSADDKIISHLAILNPRIIGLSKSLNYTFEIRHDLTMLNKQCEVFISEFRKNHNFVNSLDKCISLRWELRDRYIRNCYKYSYFKAICIIKSIIDSGINSLSTIPMNSFLFHGHLKLIHTFLQHNISNYNCNLESNLTLNKILKYDFDTYFKVIEQDSDFKEWYSEFYPNSIFNQDIERILSAMKTIDGILVHEASEISQVFGNQPKKEPLGNMCFRVYETGAFQSNYVDILTVTRRDSLTDHVSKFWNIANCIYIIKEDPEFETDYTSPYDQIRYDSMSNACYFAMVESITGMTCGTMYSNYGKSNPYNTGNNNQDPDKPKDNNSRKQNRKPRGPKPNDDPNTPKIVDAAKDVIQNIKKYGGNPVVREVVATTGKLIIGHALAKNQVDYVTDKIMNTRITHESKSFESGVPLLKHSQSKQTTTVEKKESE